MVGKVTPDDKCSASILPSLAGVNKYTTANDVLKRAFDSINGIPRPELNTEAIYWGNMMEPTIANEVCKRLQLGNPRTNYEGAFHHDEWPLCCSLDATVLGDNTIKTTDPDNGIFCVNADEIKLEGEGVLEIKLTSQDIEHEPALYRGVLQLQAQMEIMKAKWGCIGVLYKGMFLRCFLYVPDQNMLTTIKELSYDFEKRIEKYKTAQETEWYELTNGAEASRIFDESTKSEIDLPDAEPIAERILSLRQTIADAEEEVGKLEGQIMMDMRDNEIAYANRYKITWPSMNYKAVPAKTIPAKPARTIRIAKLRIKERVDG